MIRITQAGLFNNVTQRMNQTQVALAKTQEQISTGKRVLKPSDDPTTATAVMNLNTKMAQNERYGSNLDRANSLLSAQDSTLTSVTGALDRIKALVLRAANDTYNDQDRLAVVGSSEGFSTRLPVEICSWVFANATCIWFIR